MTQSTMGIILQNPSERRSKRALSGWEEAEADKGVDELILFWFAGTYRLHLPQLLKEFLNPRGSFSPNFFPALRPGTFTRNHSCKKRSVHSWIFRANFLSCSLLCSHTLTDSQLLLPHFRLSYFIISQFPPSFFLMETSDRLQHL